jgi:hypothetical protein
MEAAGSSETSISFYRIWPHITEDRNVTCSIVTTSYSSFIEEWWSPLGCNVVQSGINPSTFRNNVSSPSWGSKSKPSKKPTRITRQAYLFHDFVLRPWTLWRYVPPKRRWISIELHGVTASLLIVAAARTSNPRCIQEPTSLQCTPDNMADVLMTDSVIDVTATEAADILLMILSARIVSKWCQLTTEIFRPSELNCVRREISGSGSMGSRLWHSHFEFTFSPDKHSP